MMTTLTITLPHTPRCLSPNAKAPLTQRGAIVAGYKKTAAKSRARRSEEHTSELQSRE